MFKTGFRYREVAGKTLHIKLYNMPLDDPTAPNKQKQKQSTASITSAPQTSPGAESSENLMGSASLDPATLAQIAIECKELQTHGMVSRTMGLISPPRKARSSRAKME